MHSSPRKNQNDWLGNIVQNCISKKEAYIKRSIPVFCFLSICQFITACGNEYAHDFESFKEICVFTGGEYHIETNRCSCGRQECGAGIACENDKCAAAETVYKYCEDGLEQKCENKTIYDCKDGKWIKTDVTCGSMGCTPDGRQCALCNNEDTRCIDNKIQACVSGKFVDINDCVNGCLPDQSGCIECNNGQTQCADKHSVIKCDNGRWSKAKIPCSGSTPYCSQGICVDGGCADGETLCEGDVYTKCHGGQWSEVKFCENGCTAAGTCGECTEDICQGTLFRRCINGQFSSSVMCKGTDGKMASCSGNQCGGCYNDKQRCKDEKTPQKCINGMWVDQPECVKPKTCYSGLGICYEMTPQKECNENTRRCDNNTVSVCRGGHWTSTLETCFDCKDEFVCLNSNDDIGVKYQCHNGVWNLNEPGDSCIENGKAVSCQSDQRNCGECFNKSTKCINVKEDDDRGRNRKERSEHLVGYLIKCSDGKWLDSMAEREQCQNNQSKVSCNGDETGCGVCLNHETRCSEGSRQGEYIIEVCQNGEWKNVKCQSVVKYDCNNYKEKCGDFLNKNDI